MTSNEKYFLYICKKKKKLSIILIPLVIIIGYEYVWFNLLYFFVWVTHIYCGFWIILKEKQCPNSAETCTISFRGTRPLRVLSFAHSSWTKKQESQNRTFSGSRNMQPGNFFPTFSFYFLSSKKKKVKQAALSKVQDLRTRSIFTSKLLTNPDMVACFFSAK